MRKIPYVYGVMMALVIAGASASCVLLPARKHKVVIAFDKTCATHQQVADREVILMRMQAISSVKESTPPDGGMFTATWAGNDSLLRRILACRGEVFIAETYTHSELHGALATVMDAITDLIYSEWEPNVWMPDRDADSPVALMTYAEHMPLVDSILLRHKYLFPDDFYPAWTEKPSEFFNEPTQVYELIMLKWTRNDILLNPATVRKTGIENWYDGWQVSIALHEPYIKEWAILTATNVGRCVAFVIDGKVLSYPHVNAEITGGKLSISGVNEADATLLKAVIAGGVLECTAHIEQRELPKVSAVFPE